MKTRKSIIYLTALIYSFVACTQKESVTSLEEIKWIHGSGKCSENADPPIQVIKYNSATWILRQNKCIHYEAPFMYLFIGNDKAFLVDTGATEDSAAFPLYNTVIKIIEEWQRENNREVDLVVAHSHNHDDHYAADSQFRGKPNTTVVGLSRGEVISFFRLANWPTQSANYDLGGRSLIIIPSPGHEEAAITVYDKQTQMLLTGDSFYPGRLYVRDWSAFKESMNRLTRFCESNSVKWVVGNHIEMKDSVGLDYPTGTTYQPNEQRLPLSVTELQALNQQLKSLGDTPVYKVFDKFILVPK